MSAINYDYLINQIQRDLPTLPTIVNELTNILENPNSSTMAVEDVVRADQTLAAKILRVSNTTFFRGAGERVRDVNQAIGTVGFDKVKDVVLSNSVFKLFGGNKEDDFSLAGLWKHSLGVGSIAREIAKYLGKPWHETAYTCGLVHDIGKVARFKLDEVDNTEYFIKDTKLAQSKDINFFKAELVNQSVRHDYLGYLLCKNWGLSAWVESVVMWHHEPQIDRRRGVPSSDANILIDIVIVANWLAQYHKFGNSGHNSPEMPSDTLFQRLSLTSEHVQMLSDNCAKVLQETEGFCEVLVGAEAESGESVAGTQAVFQKKPSVKPQVGSGSMPGAVVRKPILKVKTITEQELRKDWLGVLSPFVDLEDKNAKVNPIPLKTEEKLLSRMKTVMGKKLKNKNLLEESIQITDLLDADKNKSAPQLSIEQKKLLLKEVKTAFKDSGKKKEEEVISLPPPPETELENTVLSKEKLVTQKEILSFEDLSFFPQIKELESNYPRVLCLINEVSRLLQFFTENILSSEWAKKSNELRNEGLPASLRWHRSETDWGMNEISPRLPEPKPKSKNVELINKYSNQAREKQSKLFSDASFIDQKGQSEKGFDLSQITEFFRNSVQVAVIARFLFKKVEVDESERMYQLINATYLYFFCILHNVGEIGFSGLNLQKEQTKEFGAQLVEYILILKHNLERELSGICAKENTLSEEAEKILVNQKSCGEELKQSFVNEISERCSNGIARFSETLGLLEDLKENIIIQEFDFFPECSIETGAYNELPANNSLSGGYLQLAKSILYHYTQSEQVSVDLQRDLDAHGTSMEEIHNELKRVEMATSLLAHLYSGEGLSNEKKKEYVEYFTRGEESFSERSLQSDELTAVLKERAFADIFSNSVGD